MSSTSASDKNQDYVARGLKAAIHNDNVSDEAKQSASQRLEQMGSEVPADYGHHEQSDKLNAPQARGFKSVLARDDTSEEAKERARAMLEGDEPKADFSGETNHVLGGYKATLKNPNVSDEAKQHAEEVLREAYN